MSSSFPAVPPGGPHPTRRRFVQGLASGGALFGLGLWPRAGLALQAQPEVLAGTDFTLSVGETLVNYTGKTRPAVTVNGRLPAPLLRW